MRTNCVSMAVISVSLVAMTVMSYLPVTTCSFVNFDDPEYVYQNRQVLAGISRSGWIYAWTSFDCGNWHPLTWLSLELDSSLWGHSPAGYHTTNLMFHIANVLLVFVLWTEMTARPDLSAIAAAFFAIHPLRVESVAWVAERKDVLSTFFLLLTIGAYVNYATRPSGLRYCWVLILFGLGLLAKPMLVTLPILLLLLDGWPLNRVLWNTRVLDDGRFPRQSIRFLILEKVPLLILALADGLMTVFAQRDAAKALADVTLGTRIANMFHAYSWYLQKTFVPTDLIVFYPHPEKNLSWLAVGIGVLVVFGITIVALCLGKNKPHRIVGWFWFLISLLPVIGILQVGGQAYADRYTYVPHIGLLVLIVWEANSWIASTKPPRVVPGLIVVSALVACGFLTRLQIQYWQTGGSLWAHAVEMIPDNGVAHAHLADVRLAEGDHERAIQHIERAISLKRSGNIANAYCNWGQSLLALNRPAEAEEKFLAALKIDGYHEVSLDELSKLLRNQKREAEAVEVSARHAKALSRQVKQNPDDATTQLNLGLALARQGQFKQAAQHFEKAVQLAPRSAAAHNNFALAQLQLKQIQDAKTNFLKAIELNPELAMAHFNLATILETEQDFAGAKKHFSEAIRINPNDSEAKQCLDRLSNR